MRRPFVVFIAAIAASAAIAPAAANAVTPSPRIVGGTATAIETVPWQAQVKVKLGAETPDAKYQVCGGVIYDATHVLTAAHCVYDDVAKVFARNVLFIPDQVASGTRTDTDCTNDDLGCWAPSFGVVDTDWTTRTFPNNVAWDYAYYIVPTTGAHRGTDAGTESLEQAVGTLGIDFTPPDVNVANSSVDRTTALGYSYSQDPNFMYCAEDMTTEGKDNWWLPNCGLSGGASGGPWIQPFDTVNGSGPIISVNSWGYTNQPGMAGPKLSGTSASCIYTAAKNATIGLAYTDGNAGVAVTSCP